MKVLHLVEGFLEVLPLILLLLYLCFLGSKYLYTILTVGATWGLWYIVSSRVAQKIRDITRTISEWTERCSDQLNLLFEKLCYASNRFYQEFKLFKFALISCLFKTSCIGIICTILDGDYSGQATFAGIAGMITFNVAHKTYDGRSNNERLVSALYYAVTNHVFTSKCPMLTNTRTWPQVQCVTMNWVLIYTVTILVMMYNMGVPPVNILFWRSEGFELVNILHKVFVLCLGPYSVILLFDMEQRNPTEHHGGHFDSLSEVEKMKYILVIEDRYY